MNETVGQTVKLRIYLSFSNTSGEKFSPSLFIDTLNSYIQLNPILRGFPYSPAVQ